MSEHPIPLPSNLFAGKTAIVTGASRGVGRATALRLAEGGANVVVNTAASVDHECRIDDGVHVGPGVRLGGRVHVGRGTWLGIGSVVKDGIRIGAGTIVGAGSLVLRDLPGGIASGVDGILSVIEGTYEPIPAPAEDPVQSFAPILLVLGWFVLMMILNSQRNRRRVWGPVLPGGWIGGGFGGRNGGFGGGGFGGRGGGGFSGGGGRSGGGGASGRW